MGFNQKTVCVIDGFSYVFRAFHAIRGLTNKEGMATNALFGYVNMLKKALRTFEPEYAAVALESKSPVFRLELYPEYKANRPPAPPELKEQIPYVEPLTEALGIPTLRSEGFEADDVIASLVREARTHGWKVIIISADKDLMQLVDDRVEMFDTMKEKRFDAQAVIEKYGVPPTRIVDLLAIMGDSSDNVPGVKGIGQKGAAKLITQFGPLEEILERTDQISAKRQRQLLQEHKDNALLSKKLVRLDRNAPLPMGLEDLKLRRTDSDTLVELFTKFGFHTLLRDLLPSVQEEDDESEAVTMPQPEVVSTQSQLDQLVEEIREKGRVALDTETTSLRPVAARLVGISASTGPKSAWYVPVGHQLGDQLPLDVVKKTMGPVLVDPKIGKVGQNFKYDLVVLKNHGFEVKGFEFDTMLASYILDPGRRSHSMDNLASEFLGLRTISYSDVVGKGKHQVTFDKVPVKQAAVYAAEDAWITWLLMEELAPKLVEDGLEKLLKEIEVPLSEVLADMELEGISINREHLEAMSRDFTKRLATLEKEIYELAGTSFNINSPKQLSEILFERLNLPRSRKTKTGYSTDVRVLEELSQTHKLPARILDYRSLAKLKSTYVDVLPTLINKKTGRIHTSFNQAVASTGRLSSSDPNMQNIPIRGEEGRKIRGTFVAAEGRKFVAADYSQVELRILAHISQDHGLIKAFQKGEDIHARTASEIFQVFPNMVTPDQRRVAKTINFGIVYGMSAYRLSNEQNIPFKQAQRFIDAYFKRYPKIREYIDAMHEMAREKGYVVTLLGRRRYLPQARASNQRERSMAERMAINTPVQGGAAEIVKLAMIKLHRVLHQQNLPARMLLQVHDELILETTPEYAEEVGTVLKETMEQIFTLRVPLKVDVGIGDNWAQVHG